jgi:UMF1 family MFS transporter
MKVNKALFGWTMYDFANSAFTTLIVTFIYATYFTKAIAPDEIIGTTLWSRGVTISALAVAILSPLLGSMADRSRQRKRYLLVFTVIAILSSAMLYRPLPGEVMQALFWFVIGNIAFEMGCVFYNSFLPDIASSDTIGRISGIGWGVGYIGGLAAMFVAMIGFVSPDAPWFGLAREAGQNVRATNLLVAVWFGLFSLPMFLFVHEKDGDIKTKSSAGLQNIAAELATTFSSIREYRQITRFLIARLFYNDGLITIFAFGGIYAAGTFGFSFEEIMIFGIVLNITAGAGALFFGFMDDRLGGKKTIRISLLGLLIATVLAVTTSSKPLFWLAGIMVGIFSGPNQSASRSLLGRLTPKNRKSQFFGFFAFSGKFTAFMGPLFLGLLTDLFHSQRAGMAVVIVFFLIGWALLATVNESQGLAERAVRELDTKQGPENR